MNTTESHDTGPTEWVSREEVGVGPWPGEWPSDERYDPDLLAEGDRVPFSFFLSYETLMRIMEEPKHSRVARSFVNEDRTEAVFLLRMIETRRDKYRVDVVDDLRAIVRKHLRSPAVLSRHPWTPAAPWSRVGNAHRNTRAARPPRNARS